jgi:hypothetical protein
VNAETRDHEEAEDGRHAVDERAINLDDGVAERSGGMHDFEDRGGPVCARTTQKARTKRTASRMRDCRAPAPDDFSGPDIQVRLSLEVRAFGGLFDDAARWRKLRGRC